MTALTLRHPMRRHPRFQAAIADSALFYLAGDELGQRDLRRAVMGEWLRDELHGMTLWERVRLGAVLCWTVWWKRRLAW